MRTIAIMSPKGGIAKTTSADTITYILGEEKGKKVLLIDADPQGDTSKVYQSEAGSIQVILSNRQIIRISTL